MSIKPLDEYGLLERAHNKASALPDYSFMSEQDRQTYALNIALGVLAAKINELIGTVDKPQQGGKKS